MGALRKLPKKIDAAPAPKSAVRKGTGARSLAAALRRFGLTPETLSDDTLKAVTVLVAERTAREVEIEALRARVAELERLADADSIDGVLNRRAFARELQRALAMADRHGARSALVFADLDGLKKINDALGHPAGDAALRRIVRVLLANTRTTDIVGRLGGDEFGVILAASTVASARKKSAALVEVAAAEMVGPEDGWTGRPFLATLSCGVVEIRPGSSAEDTLALADAAMYRVKKRR